MSLKDWKNGRKLNLRDAEIKDMFSYDFPLGEESNDELMETQSKRNRSKINQAR